MTPTVIIVLNLMARLLFLSDPTSFERLYQYQTDILTAQIYNKYSKQHTNPPHKFSM